jgi:hypothetical protein
MAFEDILTSVMGILQADPLLVPGILGPRTVTNQRLYRVFPQMTQFLTTYEPNQPAEGWIAVEQPPPSLRFAIRGYQTNHEYVDIVFHVYGTTFSLGHAVLDVLDTYFHWTIQQEHDVIWGDRILLFTRRYQEHDAYQQSLKLAEKQIMYAMELVRIVDLP